jgi:RNA polymerase sigma-70 factor (ECF subfamily)
VRPVRVGGGTDAPGRPADATLRPRVTTGTGGGEAAAAEARRELRDPAAEAAVDAALVRRTRDGDREAFGQLVRRHLAAAHSAAMAVVNDPTDAEDIAQDAFLTALTRLDECRPEEKFRPWLLVIVRNRAIDVRRRQRVRATEPMEAADGGDAKGGSAMPAALASRFPSPHEEAERSDARRRLEAALATQTDVRREVVLLHDLEGWSHREIAGHLGLAEGTVRAHLFWARRALRERLRSGSKENEHGT